MIVSGDIVSSVIMANKSDYLRSKFSALLIYKYIINELC